MFLIFVLPVQFNINDLGYVMYSYGPSVNIVFISSTLYIILMFTCLIRNFKNIKSKKYRWFFYDSKTVVFEFYD